MGEMHSAKCVVCGRKYYYEGTNTRALLNLMGVGDIAAGAAKLATGQKNICPDCRRAGYTNESVGGGRSASTGGGSDGDQERKERHNAALQAIKDFQFDESDETSFHRSAAMFMEDYKSCYPGLFADWDYKKTYKQRIETEIRVLKDANPAYAEKLSVLYDETKAAIKAKLKFRLIISAIVVGAGALAGGIMRAVSSKSIDGFLEGLAIGFFIGLFLSILPQIGFASSTKTGKE
ncbi:MAG: hypothetical protein VZQ47_03105 [Treponema sp.]|nr:hypothetical protein [Treponema sp.]MEE3434531.1 hypothetical protein [Treponema sp.]